MPTRSTPLVQPDGWCPTLLAVTLVATIGCSQSQTTTTQPAVEHDASAPTNDPKCTPPQPATRVEVEAGESSDPVDGVVVTYEGLHHDIFDDGSTNASVELRFSDSRDAQATDGWMPSIFGEPRFVHLRLGHCVRLVDGNEDRVVLEVFRPATN